MYVCVGTLCMSAVLVFFIIKDYCTSYYCVCSYVSGYSWGFDLEVYKIVMEIPRPDVLVANYGLAHRHHHIHEFETEMNKTERTFWMGEYKKSKLPLPRYRFFQSGPELHGKREQVSDGTYSSNLYVQNAEILRKFYVNELGFSLLDEYLVTSGRYDFFKPQSDGWHFKGTKKQMEVIMLFNMICNDWRRNMSSIPQ
jgi:hypothetical protein